MPVRVSNGPHKGDLEWHRVNRASLHNLFANPTYAGAYVYGMRPIDRRRQQPGRKRTGRRSYRLEDVDVVLPDKLLAYITWEQYQRNRAQLQSNRPASTGPARAGSALLSGLLISGRCGLRMNAQYNNNGHTGRYSCMHMKTTYGEPSCQSMTAASLDALVTSLVLQALQPAALEASIALAKDLEAERAALDHHWRQRLERARYHVERARRQYEAVEPENRLNGIWVVRVRLDKAGVRPGVTLITRKATCKPRRLPICCQSASVRAPTANSAICRVCGFWST